MSHPKQIGISRERITVELFGMARISCGRGDVEIDLPPDGGMEGIVEALADECPALVGIAIRDDLAGLLDSYTFNLNGTTFVSNETSKLREGDRLLLFSSLAGG